MAVFYIDSLTGSDALGGGSASSPFKTIARGLAQCLPGDTITVQGVDGHIHEEPDTVLITGRTNIKIQTDPAHHITIRPITTTGKATFKIQDCSGVNISGLKFTSAAPGSGHAHAILVINSSNIKILGNEISQDWKCQDVPATELFKCDNSSVELTGNFCSYIEDSYPSLNDPTHFFSFISVSGNGEYLIRNCEVTNVHANSGYAYGIKVYPDTRKVIIDDFSASNFIPAHVDYKDKMIGVLLESDNSALIYEINNVILDQLGYGIYFKHCVASEDSFLRRALIKNCIFAAITADDYSVLRKFRHATLAKCGEGICVKNNSSMHIHNAILFKNKIAFRAEVNSLLRVYYSVYYDNDSNAFTNNSGRVDLSQFVRNLDPKFVNESEDNFELTDYSPCVDTGFLFPGDTFLGAGPDIGFYEKKALFSEDDLPSLIARAARYSELVPLTEIDIMGMILKGLQTADGQIMASREGSAIKDISVKPLDLIIAPFHTELELIRERLSFDRMEKLSEDDADLLAANVFVTRDYGTYASGIVRLYYAAPTDAIVYAEHEFLSKDNLKFYCRATVAITKDEMALNYENGTYYFDIVVDAETPSLLHNLPANSITQTSMPLPPGTVGFTNPYELSGGYPAETNEELKEKCRWSISVRDIVTKKGARATLPDMFPFISEMRTIGYRDAEMERDYIALINDHIGGKSDIYVKSRNPVEDSKIIYPNSKYFEITDASFSGFVPILKILSIEILEPISEAETGVFLEPVAHYKLISRDSWVRFSTQEKIAIEFADSVVADYMPATPFKINFLWVPEMKALQSVISGDVERVVVADILARCFEPVFVSFSMSYLAPEELPDLVTELRAFVRAIPSGSEIQESDLVNVAYSAGATKVLQPMQIYTEHHTRDGKVLTNVSPDGILIPRVAAFWDGDISVSYLGSEE